MAPQDVSNQTDSGAFKDIRYEGAAVRLIRQLVYAPVPLARLAELTGLPDRRLRRVLDRLADRGLVRREGKRREGGWVLVGSPPPAAVGG
jgi:hypothetical protein